MNAKKSKALAAAQRISEKGAGGAARPPDDGPPPAQWTRAMVERAIRAFNDIERVPEYDDDAIRALVRDFLRFVNHMETGGVEDDAMPLARAFAERGYAWLAERPQYTPFTTQMWNLEMIETLILWFNDNSGMSGSGGSGTVDKKRLYEVAERFHTFERVYKTGAIEPGDAESLAIAFLDYGHRWLERQPDALAHYQTL
jgi:hypothetical protein